MLKKVLGSYINPEAVGWVTRTWEGGKADSGREIFTVFSRNGVKMIEQTFTATDHTKFTNNSKYIDQALTLLGFEPSGDD